MDLNFLPKNIKEMIFGLDINKLTEIRLRLDYPVLLKYDNKRYYLYENGKSEFSGQAKRCLKKDIEEILENITEKSVYAYNDKIKNGYITTNDGVRIGIAGECVFDKGKIITIKNVSSLNIRIPHEIPNSSSKIFNYTYKDNKIKNTLIVSPPFFGKTTILKDLALKLNKKNVENILIIDERSEFSRISGENIDVIRNSDKLFAFECGIRSMSPSVVITDELCGENDWIYVKKAVNSGVKIIASCHGGNIDNVMNKPEFINGLFETYVLLCGFGNPGIVKGIFDKDFNLICD